MRREVYREVKSLAELTGALSWVAEMGAKGLQAGPIAIRLSRPTRTLDQNSRLWAMLTDVSRQVCWHGQKYSKEVWKILLLRAWGREPMIVPAIGGGVELIDDHSSKLTVAEMSEFQTYIESFGAEHGVKWSEP